MPTKNELEAQVASLHATIAEKDAKIAEMDAQVASLTAERDGLSARVVNLETTVETVSTGHFDSDRRIKELAANATKFQATMETQIASLEALVRGQRGGQRTWAERTDTTSADARAIARTGRAPSAPTTTTQPAEDSAQPRTQGRHQHHHPQPNITPNIATGKFVTHASDELTPDEMHVKVADAMGCNKAAIHSVRKLSPTRPILPPPLASASAAAAPSSSANALPPPAVVVAATNAVFIFTTTSELAVLAVKGGLRKILRALDTPMWVDDYLSKEQQQERKRREPEWRALKDEGVGVGWRGAALWKVVKVGERDVWKIVPATPAAAAAQAAAPAAAAPAATSVLAAPPAAPGTQPAGTLVTATP
jgi:hypothetical protein